MDDEASAQARLRAERDPRRRRLLALGLLTERLAKVGIEPILVGGAALEFYTAGGYATTNVDLAMRVSEDVHATFAGLGFEREGRYWYHVELDLLFEAPAPAGLPGEDAPRTETDVDSLRIVVIGVEDLLIDRLRAWVHWKSDEMGGGRDASRRSTRTASTGAMFTAAWRRCRKRRRPLGSCARRRDRELRRVSTRSAAPQARALGEDPSERATRAGRRSAAAGSREGTDPAEAGSGAACSGAEVEGGPTAGGYGVVARHDPGSRAFVALDGWRRQQRD